MSERDPDPRSPRPSPGNLPGTGSGDDNGPPRAGQAGGGAAPSPSPAPLPGIPLGPPGFPPVFIGDRPPPPPRNSLSSMMMMLMFFFFMSNGNPPHHIVTGPDGEIAPRVTELDLARQRVGEYKGYLNGTGNWTEPATPSLLPSSLVPPRFDHSSSAAAGHPFFNNMTGWYRRATAHPVDLVAATPSAPFFDGVSVPSLNTSSWNATLAAELRGEFDWASVVTFDMNNVKERSVSTFMSTNATSEVSDDGLDPSKWAWVRGTIVLTALGPVEVAPGQRRIPPQGNREGHSSDGEDSAADLSSPVETYAEYSFYGLHFVPNGTYELYAQPDGLKMDIRHIPTLFKDQHNATARIVLAQLEKELRHQEESLLLTDVKPDEPTRTRCPLLIHLSLPPLPPGANLADLLAYEAELANPTGILSSLQRPPHYWDGLGLGGVVIADQCGWAFGVDHGKGVMLDDFWRKSINYAAYATLAQLMVLVLLVRQMEATRTPSTLAKVSLWTIVILGVTDSWIFSAHLVIGVMTDNKTGLPMLVPGFCALCTAIVFGPRYAVLLHRIQAPERTVTRPTPTPPIAGGDGNGTPTGTAGGAGTDTGTPTATTDTPLESMSDRLMNALAANRGLQWIGGVALMFIMFQLVLVPSIVPFALFAIYSIWVPQIWRNARRGSSRALSHAFVVGTSVGRLALPLYALACPENVFFVEVVDWVWGLVLWQVVQVSVLFAQDRFGPCFFLPKRFKPAEGYDYHPLLPVADEENVLGSGLGTGPRATWFEGGTTCSICMEDVDTHPVDPEGGAPSALLGLNARRSYAVAPCHHLFHTKCLAQWMAIKTICPLCKRPLPPL